MDAFIAGAESLVAERTALGMRTGAPYRVTDVPWRKVWHTMEAPEDDPGTVPDEGWELGQIRAYILRHQYPPHLWALPLHDVVYQTVPLTKAAYALLHNWSGYPETNHARAIQTEVIGFAREGLDDPELCEWLGRRVLRPILDAGVPINLRRWAPSTGSDGAGTSGTVRLTSSVWYELDGQCGHANVPKNVHWDPGRARYDLIAAAAGSTPQPPPVPESEEDEMLVVTNPRGQSWLILSGGGRMGFSSSADRDAVAKAVGEARVSEQQFDLFERLPRWDTA
jgi:hypothetical protein